MANNIPRVPVREQDPKVRATNFKEVCYGYSKEEAMLEATRCLNCKKPACMTACPVSVKIPFFIHQIAEGNFKEAAKIAKEAQPKEMWLTHFSPSLVRPLEYMDTVTDIFENAKAGKDGMSVNLCFED